MVERQPRLERAVGGGDHRAGDGAAGPGDIMLFHAGKPNTAEALRRVIDTLAAQGYRFAPVGELVYGPPYTIDHTGRQHK